METGGNMQRNWVLCDDRFLFLSSRVISLTYVLFSHERLDILQRLVYENPFYWLIKLESAYYISKKTWLKRYNFK